MAQKHPLEYAHVFSTEPISLMIVPDSASLDAALVITDKWKPAWNSPVQVLSKELSEYPKPKFERVQHKGIKLRKFTRPSSLISLRSTAVDEATYTLSQENVDWLHTFNRTANPGPPLSEEALESAIVALERACERHFQTMHQEFVSAAPHDKKASSTTTAAATTATAPDTLPPSPWRSVLTRAVYRPRRSGEPVDQPLCCEDLRDRIDVRTLSTSLGLSRVVCAAIVEHWLACRAADGLRPLVALFRKPTISETLLGDRFPLHDVRTVMARGRASLRRAARIADLVVQRELAKRALIQATLNQFTSDALTRIKATDKTHARLVPALHTVLATHSAPLPVPPLPLPPPSPATTASHSATAGHGAGRSASSSKARHRQPAPASSTAHAAVAKAAATGRPRDSTHTSARERTKGIRLTTPAGRATARRRKEENEEEYVVSSDADTDGEDDESEVSEMSDSESEREEEGTESGDSGDEDVSSVSGESESEADSSGGEPMSTDEDSDHSSSGSGSGSVGRGRGSSGSALAVMGSLWIRLCTCSMDGGHGC
eukprot:m.102718 g.102718  ORF g.102718 m.102718 type:complete len:546 (+) comp14125_c0_seq2:98-1735(+)